MNLAGYLFRKDYLRNPQQAPLAGGPQWGILPCLFTSSLAEQGRGNESESQGGTNGQRGGGALLLCCFFFSPSRGTDLFIQALASSILTLPVSLEGSALHTLLTCDPPPILWFLKRSILLAILLQSRSLIHSSAVNFREYFVSLHHCVWMSMYSWGRHAVLTCQLTWTKNTHKHPVARVENKTMFLLW